MIQEKKCSKCGLPKKLSEFSRHPKNKDGLQSQCIECQRNRKLTKKGLITTLYSHQKYRSIKGNYPNPSYTNKELREWCFNQSLFHKLFEEWIKSKFNKDLIPSIDRKNDYKGYSFENIQLMTWLENNKKGNLDRKNGINNKKSRAIIQYDLNGNFIREYYSIMQAERETGISNSNICKCGMGNRNKANGFIWKFK